MSNNKDDSAKKNTNKKTDVKSITKPKVRAGSPIFANCTFMLPIFSKKKKKEE